MIGTSSLGCEGYKSSCNYTASLKRDQARTTAEWKAHQRQVSLLCRRLAGIINPKPPIDLPQRLIIPIMIPPDMIGHSFLIKIFVYIYNLMIVGTLFAVKKYSSMSGNMLGHQLFASSCHQHRRLLIKYCSISENML